MDGAQEPDKNPLKGGDPCGSSSGSAISVAANMAMVSLGMDTDGSLICPGDRNSVDSIVGHDPRDAEATDTVAKFIPDGNYVQFLKEDGLKGKRLGYLTLGTMIGSAKECGGLYYFEDELHSIGKVKS
ncbi:hypothetical protein OROMI_014466 [Orobanche minor]